MSNSAIDMSTFESLRQMSGADFIGELIDTFLDDAPRLIKELHSTRKAGDAESFRRAAHSLKSNSATFGALQLSGLARDLEMLGKENKLGEVGNRLKALEDAYRSVDRELKRLRP